MFESIVLKNGKVHLNDCCFQCNDSLDDLYNILKEDLLQIEFNHSYLIDVGWYPEFDSKGSFKIMLIKNYKWEDPVHILETRSLIELENIVEILIKSVDTM